MIVSSNTAEEYIHYQTIPSTTWVVEHNLFGYPSITVIDSANSQVEGDVVFDTVNQVTINFSYAFSGKAVCR